MSAIAIAAGVTAVPRLLFEVALGAVGGGALIVHAALKVFDAMLGAYLFFLLRRQVRGRFGLRPPDPILAWWTGFAAFLCCLSLLLPGWSAGPIWLAALLVAVTAAVCLDIALGVILLRLKDDPNRWLNAYAVAHIACGLFIIASTMF